MEKVRWARMPPDVWQLVAECMEFILYGEYREGIHSAEEAVKIYQSIPSERLNAGKGIGGFMWRKKMVFHWNFPWFIMEN